MIPDCCKMENIFNRWVAQRKNFDAVRGSAGHMKHVLRQYMCQNWNDAEKISMAPGARMNAKS